MTTQLTITPAIHVLLTRAEADIAADAMARGITIDDARRDYLARAREAALRWVEDQRPCTRSTCSRS